MSMAKGARQQGVTIAQGVTVTDVVREGRGRDRPSSPTTAPSSASTSSTRPACGPANSARCRACPSPCRPPSTTTSSPSRWRASTPRGRSSRIRRNYGYYREEVGGLMIGLFEAECAPWNVGGIPNDSSFTSIQPDWDRMGPYVEAAMSRVPLSFDTGIRTFFCGPESFTPDLRPIVGEAPEVRNYFIAAGLNSIGILTGGGLGRLVAHWIVDGHPDMDVTGMDPARLQRVPDQPRVPPHSHRRVVGHGVPVPLPEQGDDNGARRQAFPHSRATRGSGRVLQGRQRVGGRRLVRRAGRDPRRRSAHMGPAGILAAVGRRAPRLSRGRHPHGHELHVEVPRYEGATRAECSTPCRPTR